MRNSNFTSEISFECRINWLVALAASALLVVGFAQLSFSQESKARTFSSPGEASNALFQAVQNEDEQGVEAILGGGKEITSSSDEVEDKLEHDRFSQKYQEMHRLVREPDGRTVLYIGAENWPFPIPLISRNGAWSFDSDTGMQEIMFRTVGENETTAIQVCRAAVAEKKHDTKAKASDPISEYAEKLATTGTASAPYHGYYFRIVRATPAAATKNDVTDRKKNSSVTLVAYPAEYRSSGVMTFAVTQKGVVYEKDLGPKTEKIAPDLKQCRPASSWHAAE